MYRDVVPPTDDITTIDDVIAAIEALIAYAHEHEDRVGYFACTYRRVTRTIKAMLGQGFFDDDGRLERLDVTFARRYLGALRDYDSGGPQCTPPWRRTLAAVSDPELVLMQQLTTAAACHIRLDLGVACAEVAKDPGALANLKPDFDRMNTLLGAMAPAVFSEIGHVSPAIHVLADLVEPIEHPMIDLGLRISRGTSWSLSQTLVTGDPASRRAAYDERIADIVAAVESTVRPPLLLRPPIAAVRALESKDVRTIIDALNVDELLEFEGHSIVE